MIETSYRCDGPNCTAVRGPSNHWLLLYADSVDFSIKPWDDRSAADKDTGYKHVCGAACAHKLLDRYLESLRKE